MIHRDLHWLVQYKCQQLNNILQFLNYIQWLSKYTLEFPQYAVLDLPEQMLQMYDSCENSPHDCTKALVLTHFEWISQLYLTSYWFKFAIYQLKKPKTSLIWQKLYPYFYFFVIIFSYYLGGWGVGDINFPKSQTKHSRDFRRFFLLILAFVLSRIKV